MSRTCAAAEAMLCPWMKTASAFRAAYARPRSDVPAWNSTGVRWGVGGTAKIPRER
ncbi:MAG: hypothetical protein K0Q58_402 [Microbacterium sp.]|nr:hypothetical protein [Microbacterium sp.]